MTLILGITYILMLMLLGTALRIFFKLFTNNKNKTTVNLDYCIHSFFQGILCLIVLLNFIQLVEISNDAIIILLTITFSICLIALIKDVISSQFTVPSITHSQAILYFTTLILIFLIYSNGALLPNIAWDSWSVWEGRANQWIEHGLYVKTASTYEWLNLNDSIFNQSSNYPEGLSLLYFVPKLFFQSSFSITHFLYLFAYAFTVLIIQRHIKYLGASFFLQLFLILMAFTLPLMSNHLMILGYADIWVAMILVLVILAYIDFSTLQTKASLITLLGYICLLPMFKLEGWIWLSLLVLAHLISSHKDNKKAKLILIIIVAPLVLSTWIGVNLKTPFGPLILSSEQVNIFSLVDLKVKFNNISDLLMSSLFWQNNWSLIWLGLPFLIISFFRKKQDKTSKTIHLFFTLSILSFLFLFYFTKASQWAEDFTAINRVVLQLTPCYLLLLFKMLTHFELSHNKKHQQLIRK